MEDLPIFNINDQLKTLKDHTLEISENNNQFATHLAKSDSERQKLKDEIIAKVEQIYKNYEPHMPRHSTCLTEEKLSVEVSFTPLLGENDISAKDIPKLEQWPTFSGEGEYNHIKFIRTIDMFQEDFNIPDEIIVGNLHHLFTKTAKKWYYKMRIDHGKHDWSWWKSEVITKWANKSWRFKMENAFENSILNSEKDKPLTWFFKQKYRLSSLHPDMSHTMIKMRILRKCGGELEHAIKSRCVEPCSTEDYINEMEDIITRTRIVSEDTPVEDYTIENITAFFEVTEVHNHLPQYSEDCHTLINIQDSRRCKAKPSKGKGYTAGTSCITSILINGIEAKVNLDTGAFCTCVGNDYPQAILPEWEHHLLPIEGVQFSSASNNMYPLGILDTNIVFQHPTGSIRMKTEIVVMDNCTSQHTIPGNDYLNIYGIDINNHKDRYFTIGDDKRQKIAFSNMPKQISVVSSVKDTCRDKFVSNKLVEANINPSLSEKMRNELIDMLYTYNNAFASDNEPLGAIRGHEIDITLNIDRPYPPVLRRPAYPASPRAREAL
ncbi:hypothetical protein O181_105994 [Austropuccinia psidii MF-1]|uniref:Uncharacterized protein n=1 Tax=Austropuccinia psidii MF-1 TaxID=1389203 RepID=A0A9Q3JQH6_9BASI|nr:hypothetical protein [Austropuccinia psidii MF-1]